MSKEQIVLVAFCVYGDTTKSAQEVLFDRLKDVRGGEDEGIDSWWIAEDERYDRSDCDSATFCRPGKQREATALLRSAGLAY